MSDNNLIEYMDTRDSFLDLYSSIIKFKGNEKITIYQYCDINEAIDSARKTLYLLDRVETNGCEYLAEQRGVIHQRLEDLLQMRDYFNQEDRIIHKPKRKIVKRKKGKESLEIKRFYQVRDYFVGKRYAKAVMIENEDIISMTQYAELFESVELGEIILEDINKIRSLNNDEKYLEDKLKLIKAVREVKEIRKSFSEGPKGVYLDDEWINYH